jgi:hypothetical protein
MGTTNQRGIAKNHEIQDLLQQPRQGQVCQERISVDGLALDRAQAKRDQTAGTVYAWRVLMPYTCIEKPTGSIGGGSIVRWLFMLG